MVTDPTPTKKWLRAKADKIGVAVTEQSEERNNKKAVPKADCGKDSTSDWTTSLEHIPVFSTREILFRGIKQVCFQIIYYSQQKRLIRKSVYSRKFH